MPKLKHEAFASVELEIILVAPLVQAVQVVLKFYAVGYVVNGGVELHVVSEQEVIELQSEW